MYIDNRLNQVGSTWKVCLVDVYVPSSDGVFQRSCLLERLQNVGVALLAR